MNTRSVSVKLPPVKHPTAKVIKIPIPSLEPLPFCVVDFQIAHISEYNQIELRLVHPDGYYSEAILPNMVTLIKLPDPQLSYGHYHFELHLINAKSCPTIKKLQYHQTTDYSVLQPQDFKRRILLVTPIYPSDNIPYLAPFIHEKVKKYQQLNLDVDVALINYEDKLYRFQYDGVQVVKLSHAELYSYINSSQYYTILIHFFDVNIARTILAADLSHKQVLIYSHGAEVDLYTPIIFQRYDQKTVHFTAAELAEKQQKSQILKQFDSTPTVTWVFNTKWNLNNAQKVTGLAFKRHIITPCIINSNLFAYQPKSADQRYHILILKKMNNSRLYSVDLAAKIIQLLSKKSYFSQLHFTVVGDGDYQTELTRPLQKYPNVKIIKKLYPPAQVAELFHHHGILLAPSRYDTQGVTVGEAAMAGLTVLASSGTGVSDMLPESLGTFFDNRHPSQAVNIIDQIVKSPEYYTELCQKTHQAISKTASEKAVTSDLKYLQKAPPASSSPAQIYYLSPLKIAYHYLIKDNITYAPAANINTFDLLNDHFYSAVSTIKELAPQVAKNYHHANLQASFIPTFTTAIENAYYIALFRHNNYREFRAIDRALRPYPVLYRRQFTTSLDQALPGVIFATRKYKLPYFLLRKLKHLFKKTQKTA